MKTYVEYLDISPVTGELYKPCGDRSIVQLDSRNTLDNMHKDAREFNGYRRPVYHSYQIIQGNALRDAKPITDVISLED